MSLEYRIEKADSFRIVGIKCATTNEAGKGMNDVLKFWEQAMSSDVIPRIMPLLNQKPFGLLGVTVYNTSSDDDRKFDYYIACSTSQEAPEDLSEYTVPACTWAIFPCKRENTGEVMVKIVTDWLPDSGFNLVNTGYETGRMKGGAPDLEVYSQGDDVEIWIAVQEK